MPWINIIRNNFSTNHDMTIEDFERVLPEILEVMAGANDHVTIPESYGRSVYTYGCRYLQESVIQYSK